MAERVFDLEIDEWNETEMWRHRVTTREVRQVLDEEPRFFRNVGEHDAELLMVGPTFGGRLLTVPLARTAVVGVWRPASAWDADAEERAKYWAARGR